MNIEQIESRFKEIAKITEDISYYPIPRMTTNTQTTTNKVKSDTFGEVFTPLWLVDEMIDRVSDSDWKDQSKTTLDLCAGYGQFTIRLIRKKYTLLGDSFDINSFLTQTHHFSELQLDSCYNLLYIFGADINLFIGDSRELPKLNSTAKGIWVFRNSCWSDITEEIKTLFSNSKLDVFVGQFDSITVKQLSFMEW